MSGLKFTLSHMLFLSNNLSRLKKNQIRTFTLTEVLFKGFKNEKVGKNTKINNCLKDFDGQRLVQGNFSNKEVFLCFYRKMNQKDN